MRFVKGRKGGLTAGEEVRVDSGCCGINWAEIPMVFLFRLRVLHAAQVPQLVSTQTGRVCLPSSWWCCGCGKEG